MRKPILVLSLLVSLTFTACSSDDDNGEKINTPPTAVTLEIAEEDANSSIQFSWNASVDADGDDITYDFYVNDEVLVSNLTTLEYVWEIDGTENHRYPATFKVVAKDNELSSDDSNIVSVQDPLIGKWQLESRIENDIEEDLTACQKLSTSEFFADGSYEGHERQQEEVDGECLENVFQWQWSNKGDGNYGILYEEATEDDIFSIAFENNKMIVVDTYPVDGETIVKTMIYKKIN